MHKSTQKGFTLIELLVVIIIIGILAAIAVPAFLNQRTKGYDAAAKSDLKNAATAMETFHVDGFKYPVNEAELNSAGFTVSKGVTYRAFVIKSGPNPGYVVFAKHDQSSAVWMSSSWRGVAPTKITMNTLPTSIEATSAVSFDNVQGG